MIKYRIIAENKYSVSEACRIAKFCKNISKTLRNKTISILLQRQFYEKQKEYIQNFIEILFFIKIYKNFGKFIEKNRKSFTNK